MNYYNDSSSSNIGHFTVQFLYHLGINKLDNMLLTHGDYDHAGEALNIIKEIEVSNIYFNNNKLNSLEKEIWKHSSKEKAKLNTDDSFSLGNFKFQVISGKFIDENDSSTVLYSKINNNKLLFMGDATIKSENDILANYDLSDITLLKVGHHGSKTSSSKKFIEKITPRYAFISAGIDNKFSHPSKEVVKRLRDNKVTIYNTQDKGMVLFDFTNNKINWTLK